MPTSYMNESRTVGPETSMTAEVLLTSFDCVVFDREAVYASSEFTTGKRFYELCRALKVYSVQDLKRALGGERYRDELLLANKEEGVAFARKIRGWGIPLVISPNPLVVHGWTQEKYLDLWVKVITEKCHAVYFNDGWEFSNGCTKEYLATFRCGLPAHDSNGHDLPVDVARRLIRNAVECLQGNRFKVPELEEILAQL
jgi:hypothetical protein